MEWYEAPLENLLSREVGDAVARVRDRDGELQLFRLVGLELIVEAALLHDVEPVQEEAAVGFRLSIDVRILHLVGFSCLLRGNYGEGRAASPVTGGG